MTDTPPPVPPPVPPPPPPPGASPPPPPPPPHLVAPPGYAAYTASPMGMVRLQRVRTLATAASILVAINALAQFASLATTYSLRGDARRFLDGEIDDREFTRILLRQSLTGSLVGACAIAAAIVTMIWMYRVMANHRALHRGTTWAAGWAIGGWFLPPMLYVIPFLVLREMWKASDPAVPLGGDWRRGRGSPVAWLWFLAYSIVPAVLLVASAASGAYSGAFDFGNAGRAQAELITGTQVWNILAAGVGLVAAASFVVLLRSITDRHAQLTGEATRAA